MDGQCVSLDLAVARRFEAFGANGRRLALPFETGTTCGDCDTRQNKQDLAMYRNKHLTRHLKCLLFASLFLAINLFIHVWV